jgi:3-oxoacyl-[acyl-carrier protein] reductase
VQSDRLFPDGAALVLGASGGIGAAVAEVLARDGSDVALVGNRRADKLAALAQGLHKAGRNASAHQADVTDRASLDALIAEVEQQHGRIHTLVWAVGPLVEQHLLAETPQVAWQAAIDTEVHGFINCVSAVLPAMRRAGGGSIVHLGSAGHLRWPARDGLSVVPKAANESFLRGIAREEGEHGIRANSVLVGVIDAGMFHELMAKGAFPQGWTEQTLAMLSVKRWGQPEEIGYAVSWLASARAAYVTGQQINVSGGFGL